MVNKIANLIVKKVIKTSELVINYVILIILIIYSFLSRPGYVCIEGFPEINDQNGIIYLILITFSISASIIIIWRLIRPNIGLRIISFIIILCTVILIYIDSKPHARSLYGIIRSIIFEN